MKFLIILTLITMSLFVHSFSIVPEKTVTPLLDIFSTKNQKLSETLMEVRVSTHSKNGAISKGRKKISIPMDDYEKAYSQSKAVYEMVKTIDSTSWSGRDLGRQYYGTAFHIGENLVLTNLHVLSPTFTNTTECSGFRLHQNDPQNFFPCKKVHYCSVEHDVCLIEMSPMKYCLNAFCTKYEMVQMKEREALKLSENQKVDFPERASTILTAIGNTMGLGIHYSQGKGIDLGKDIIRFFAPVRSGNSGGPLIGEDGLVLGVVKKESEEKVGPEAYNVAASMNVVIDLMRENITDETTLMNFNNAIEN